MSKVAIVGGGASGIFAACVAAQSGADVTILEKNPRIGKKILSTGNGRCNFTNINATGASYNSDFADFALKKFSPYDAISFFEKIGMLTKVEDEGRCYPMSCQASAVLDVLRLELERLDVKCITDFSVGNIVQNEGGFVIYGQNGSYEKCEKLIIATGGKAAPKLGSNGEGYALLKSFGHTTTKLGKSLVQIKTDKSISGVRQYGRVTMQNGETRTGEIQFNNYGLSGIPVFGVSKYAKNGDIVTLDLMPDYSESDVIVTLENRPAQTMETYLIGILNKSLGHMLLKECNISPLSRSSDSLSDAEIAIIAKKLKNWQFEITGVMPWDNAQVTAGGIELSEVCEKTMESKIVKGLYIIGELLDIDADCGGYNLQWAWSSGYLAGSEASRV